MHLVEVRIYVSGDSYVFLKTRVLHCTSWRCALFGKRTFVGPDRGSTSRL